MACQGYVTRSEADGALRELRALAARREQLEEEYIYIYINLSLYIYIYTYVYIHIYTYMHVIVVTINVTITNTNIKNKELAQRRGAAERARATREANTSTNIIPWYLSEFKVVTPILM